MTAGTLLHELEGLGVVLFACGDRLHYDAPQGALTLELRGEIAAHKPELIALLTSSPLAPAPSPSPPDWPASFAALFARRAATLVCRGLPPAEAARRAFLDLDQLIRATVAAESVVPPPWRAVVATWPDARRERWGVLANSIEAAGLTWREAEGRAFAEVKTEMDAEHDPEPTSASESLT